MINNPEEVLRMNTFEKIKAHLSHKTVGIAGCGGLGSNCAVALARVGIGKLIIADFDVIDLSNLNRQYYFFDQIGKKKCVALKENIQRINPDVITESHDIKLHPADILSLFYSCDIIVEAFDLAEMKEMIIETVLTEMPHTPLICGLGMAGWGMNAQIHSHNIDNLYICGDEATEISPECPPLAPRVGIVANMQANVALELLLKDMI